MDVVAGGELCGEGWVVEVPHERRGIEEVDCRYAEGHESSLPVGGAMCGYGAAGKGISLRDDQKGERSTA